MTNRTVPARTWLAARRAFIRTTAQAYAAALPIGGVNVVLLEQLTTAGSTALLLTAGAWIASPLIAGSAAFLSIVGAGVPDEYAAAARSSEPGL